MRNLQLASENGAYISTVHINCNSCMHENPTEFLWSGPSHILMEKKISNNQTSLLSLFSSHDCMKKVLKIEKNICSKFYRKMTNTNKLYFPQSAWLCSLTRNQWVWLKSSSEIMYIRCNPTILSADGSKCGIHLNNK